MAITFKNAKLPITTSMSTVYTCPAATTAIITGLDITNIDGVNSANVSGQWLDDSDSDTATKIAHLIPVPAGSKIPNLVKGLVLEAGDALQLQASANSDLVGSISIMERT